VQKPLCRKLKRIMILLAIYTWYEVLVNNDASSPKEQGWMNLVFQPPTSKSYLQYKHIHMAPI
jgi:hypothetical protein